MFSLGEQDDEILSVCATWISKIEFSIPAEEEFEDLCFDYGLELDEVVSNVC